MLAILSTVRGEDRSTIAHGLAHSFACELGQPDVLGVVVNRARRVIPGSLFRRI